MHGNSMNDEPTLLGVSFFSGSLYDAIAKIKDGGLLTAPSGPGMANDLPFSKEYRRALHESEVVLADSGLLCLWNRFFGFQKKLNRISGLLFLKEFICNIDFTVNSSFWIMPDHQQAIKNFDWLEKTLELKLTQSNLYVAPKYTAKEKVRDEQLLREIDVHKPKYIFVQIGGGVQERLGLYLKEELNYKPVIICTGAALAFLTGCQTRIPPWADKYYIGWLLRCLGDPITFIPRYIRAIRLIFLLFKYRANSPVA